MKSGEEDQKRHDSRSNSVWLRATGERTDDRPAPQRKQTAPQRQTRKTRQSGRQ